LVRLVALAVGVQLVALVSATVLEDVERDAPRAAPTRARAVLPAQAPAPLVPAQTPQPTALPTSRPERAAAVERLLQDRARAVLQRDRQGFLATVDPSARELVQRQAATFDGLAQVPLATWEYVLQPGTSSRPDERLDRRYGRGRWWGPQVALRYALAGFDERPVVVDHHLTFVLRDGRWLLGADDDFALQGRATPRAIWDRGPVVAVRRGGVLVLGHPGQRRLLDPVAALTAAAVPRVTAGWGPWPERVVVLVPDDTQELAGLLGSTADLSRIAAVATAELRGGEGEYDPAGDRVLVNPETFAGLGALGQQVVLTHEVTHVATRRASGPAVPGWLAEGFADLVGYSGVDLPLSVTAADLAGDVRAGRTPTALPVDADFEGGSLRLSQAYQGAWLAVRLLDERHGRDALLRFYRVVGARRGVPAATAVEDALRAELGTTTTALTADWRAFLQRRLA
jgi:hypothetical protein